MLRSKKPLFDSRFIEDVIERRFDRRIESRNDKNSHNDEKDSNYLLEPSFRIRNDVELRHDLLTDE